MIHSHSSAQTHSVLIEASAVGNDHTFLHMRTLHSIEYLICPELFTLLDPESKPGCSDSFQSTHVSDFFFFPLVEFVGIILKFMVLMLLYEASGLFS